MVNSISGSEVTIRSAMDSIRSVTLIIIVSCILVFTRPSRPQSVRPNLSADHTESSDSFVSFCETETFHASCAVDEVIVITHARYGRMHISRCVKLDYGHLGCSSDVIELADSRCSGRRRCEIRIPDSEFAKYKPCPDDLKPYLEIGYRCLKVQTSTEFCTFPQSTPVTSSQTGHLASLVTEMTGCGGVTTPWTIEVSQGQVIRLTLYDFGVVRTKRGLARPSSSQCHTYAILREPGQIPGPGGAVRESRNVTVCGGALRQSVVYVTATNRLEIGLVRSDNNLLNGPHYLFEYQALGCPDLPSFQNAWYIRSGDSLTVKCNFSKDVHQMKCRENTWTGDKWNCTAVQSAANVDKQEKSTMSIPYGLSVLIVLVIALAIGAFVLCVGLLFLKRRNFGSCIEDRSPITPFAGKHFTTSTLVRNLTGSIALHPDKLPWPNAQIASYGSNKDENLPHCLSGGVSDPEGDQTRLSPTRIFQPPPYYSTKQPLPCTCTSVWDGDHGTEHYDVTSGCFAHERSTLDPEEEVRLHGQLADFYVLDNRGSRCLSSSVFKLSGSRRENEKQESKQELVDPQFTKNSRPNSFPSAEVANFHPFMTSADVTRAMPPKFISDCYTEVVGLDDVIVASDSTPEEIL